MEQAIVDTLKLNEIAVNRIIDRAKGFIDDSELTRRQVYDSAKHAIWQFTESADEYDAAVRRLAKELNL